MGTETYHALKAVLKKEGLATGLGDEGGFAPNLSSNRAALDLISAAVEKAGYSLGSDIVFALDVAATEFHADGAYAFEGRKLSSAEMTEYYTGLVDSYPIVSIEDPLSEEDWDGWISLTARPRRPGADRRRRPVRHQPHPPGRRHRAGRGQRAAGQGQPDRHAHRDPRRGQPGPPQRLPLDDEPPLGRDRGHHDRRPRRRHRLRADQDRCPGPQRAGGQVQPAAAHRGGARRRRALRRRRRLPPPGRG